MAYTTTVGLLLCATASALAAVSRIPIAVNRGRSNATGTGKVSHRMFPLVVIFCAQRDTSRNENIPACTAWHPLCVTMVRGVDGWRRVSPHSATRPSISMLRCESPTETIYLSQPHQISPRSKAHSMTHRSRAITHSHTHTRTHTPASRCPSRTLRMLRLVSVVLA